MITVASKRESCESTPRDLAARMILSGPFCGCRWILAHYSLQRCFSSVTFAGIRLCTTILRSRHGISVRLRSGLGLNHCNIMILFFFSHSAVNLLLWMGSLSCGTTQFWSSFICRTDVLIVDSRILQRRSWLTQRLQGSRPMATKQAQIITLPPPCQTVGLCCYAEFGFCIVHYGQTSSLWSCLSKAHCSRRLILCSDVALLPCSF